MGTKDPAASVVFTASRRTVLIVVLLSLLLLVVLASPSPGELCLLCFFYGPGWSGRPVSLAMPAPDRRIDRKTRGNGGAVRPVSARKV
jgi:hypothetical protein